MICQSASCNTPSTTQQLTITAISTQGVLGATEVRDSPEDEEVLMVFTMVCLNGALQAMLLKDSS